MCGRYTLTYPDQIFDRFDASPTSYEYRPSYNIAPGQFNPVITRRSPNKAELMKWGLVPHWAKDEKIGYKMINARAETIAEKPSFKRAFKSQRCIVPASGFYEWMKSGKDKIPYYIHLKNQELIGFAGIFEEWEQPNGETLKTYSIITTTPNKLMAEIHDRMPAILGKEYEDDWLGEDDPNFLKSLLSPISPNLMEAYPVSKDVNTPRNNTSELIEKVDM